MKLKLPTVLILLIAIVLLHFGCRDANHTDTENNTTNGEQSVTNHMLPATAPKSYNNLARYIAGLPQDNDNAYKNLEALPNWKKFSTNLTQKFNKLDSIRFTKMRNWRNVELSKVNAETEVLFYPFSGPDFLNAYTFFPDAKEYIMLALEPPGKLPIIDILKSDTANQYLSAVENGLKAILSFSFFRTIAMEDDFTSQKLDGVVHLVALFAVKTGNKILDIQTATINEKGQIITSENYNCNIKGFTLTFEDSKTHQPKKINYFSLDVSDEALQNNPCFKTFAGNLGANTTYLKSASYLLHLGNFSFMRNTILAHSNYILQDDSGVPLKFFKDSVWQKTLYGSYDKPINLFRNKFQQNLYTAYNDSANKPAIKTLPFGIGYDYKDNESNLMLFTKKKHL